MDAFDYIGFGFFMLGFVFCVTAGISFGFWKWKWFAASVIGIIMSLYYSYGFFFIL